MMYDIGEICGNLSNLLKFHLDRTVIITTLHTDIHAFLHSSRV
jgi:hypothetical protein